MKLLGCLVLVVVLVVGGFVGVLVWSLHLDEDQSALTQRVEVSVLDPREDSRGTAGFAFDYAYEAGGRWWGGEDWIRDNYWQPGRPLTACVDPDDPRRHVITIRREKCGRQFIVGTSIEEGVPVEAP